jgi:4-nitrophenol 2-monooxygenase / 4-nitrocatechol 4-monooxygenase, reductase component
VLAIPGYQKMASTQKAITHAQVFAVNILRESQSAVARQFATSHADKFYGMRVSYGQLGAPLLNDTLAAIECRVVEEVAGGTHSVFLAEVHSAQATVGMPLTYFRGKMGRFEFITSGNAAPLWRHMQWQDYD